MVAHLRHGNARLEVRCSAEFGARTNAVSASSCALPLNGDRFGNRARNGVSSELPTKRDADDFIESLRPREFRLCCRAPAPPLYRDAPGAKCRGERLRVPTANQTNRVFSPSYGHQCLPLAPHAGAKHKALMPPEQDGREQHRTDDQQGSSHSREHLTSLRFSGRRDTQDGKEE